MNIILILIHLNTGMITEVTQHSMDSCQTNALKFIELGYGSAYCEVR